MSTALPDCVDAERLAAHGGVLPGVISPARAVRVSELFRLPAPLVAELRFARDALGKIVVEGSVRGTIIAVCQRCLEPFENEIVGGIVHEIAPIGAVSDSSASVGAAENAQAFAVLALAEDEFILACPMIPLHPDGICVTPDERLKNTSGSRNPFDVLAALRQNGDT
ncbi:MAG: hypothetical protein HYX63_12080 [Gammaproteobacteria bacterium]|nr:hypothetical protein [Gammaproteobacteria bacterium]